MQKTAEMIEGVVRHFSKILADPSTPPHVREAAERLVARLKADIQLANETAKQSLQ